jgi:hypothetical protein
MFEKVYNKTNDIIAFSCYETIGMGILNPRTVSQITGPPELLEKIAALLEKFERYCDDLMIESSELRPEELDVIFNSMENL